MSPPRANLKAPSEAAAGPSRLRRDGRPDRRSGNGGAPPPREPDCSWWDAFCAAYRLTGSTRLAARSAGVHRRTHQRHLSRFPEYREMFEEAREDFADLLEEQAHARAMRGSDRLLIAMLRTHRPELYGARAQARPYLVVTREMLDALPDEVLDRITDGTHTAADISLLTGRS